MVEDFGPGFVRLVGGQQEGALLVSLADDLENFDSDLFFYNFQEAGLFDWFIEQSDQP